MSISNTIKDIVSFIFSPLLEQFGVGYFVLFMAFFITLCSTLLYRRLTPQTKIKRLRKEVSELSAELKTHIGDKETINIIKKEITKKNWNITTKTMWPNFILIVPNIYIFTWMNSVLKVPVYFYGYDVGWLITFIAFSILCNIILRRMLDVS